METNKRIDLFSHELSSIHNGDIKDMAVKALLEANDYFFVMPASTSGKYHPTFSLGDGGLVRHTRAVIYFLGELYRSQLFNITPREFELLILGAICHDIKKGGETEGISHTVKDHPLLAAKFLESINDNNLSEEELEFVTKAVMSHMGVWGEKDGLPTPKTESEKLLHLADLMASRKDIDVKFISEGVECTERTSINESSHIDINVEPKDFIMPFGKFAGKTLSEINEEKPDYIEWCVNKFDDGNVKEMMKKYLENKENS